MEGRKRECVRLQHKQQACVFPSRTRAFCLLFGVVRVTCMPCCSLRNCSCRLAPFVKQQLCSSRSNGLSHREDALFNTASDCHCLHQRDPFLISVLFALCCPQSAPDIWSFHSRLWAFLLLHTFLLSLSYKGGKRSVVPTQRQHRRYLCWTSHARTASSYTQQNEYHFSHTSARTHKVR